MAKSQTYDRLKVSLLTIEPRPGEVYTVYGHTALRLSDPSRQMDAVLNWGTFDFQTSNFLYRFLKGETDYCLSMSAYGIFYYSYSRINATVVEQVLDIPDEEKGALIEALTENLLPQNLEYRYNFLFDNCTTRPRDIIEKFCGGKLIYPEQTEQTTFRDLIHSCTHPYPWMTFGIDLLIGNGADSLINVRQELFLPGKLMEALNHSFALREDGEEHPLVVSSEVIIQSTGNESPQLRFWDSPLIAGFLVFFVYLFLTVWGGLKKRRFRGFFAPLFFIAGLAGCLVAFITLFSYHPCTSPNWNLLWLHPFHLIAFAGYFFKKSFRFISWYHIVNLVLLSCLFFGWHWIPQVLNTADIPYILCLGLASGYWLYAMKRIDD
jgi:hypothetical protein